jgi:uncharacterized protein
MRFAKFMGAAALAIAAMQAAPALAQGMDMKISASNPVVSIGVTENEEAMPDMATVTAGVLVKLPDAKKALDGANKDMAKLIVAIRAAGIDPKDVQTSSVSVNENTNYTDNGAVTDGYRATSTVTLTVRDLAKLKTLMSDLVAAGATQLDGPFFAIDDEDALTDKARMKAFDTAKRRAMAYASKAGFKSVRLLKVNENAEYEGIEYAAADASAAAMEIAPQEKAIADTPIEPGLISRAVTATFHFEMVP